MAYLRTWQALGVGIIACHSALAAPSFNSSEIEGEGSEIIFCDLDGDHLKDAVLVNGLALSIFFQDAKGFSREPQLKYLLDDRPSVLWPAKLRKDSESLLVMTSDGVAELNVTNHTARPVRQQI